MVIKKRNRKNICYDKIKKEKKEKKKNCYEKW